MHTILTPLNKADKLEQLELGLPKLYFFSSSFRQGSSFMKYRLLVLLLACLLLNSGCAAYMASQQPKFKELQKIVNAGNDRGYVVAELGQPISKEVSAKGNLVEYYQFTQGYQTHIIVSRVIVHIAGDFFTLFLWEAIGIPIELIWDGEPTVIKATYDNERKLKNVLITKKG